MSVSFTKLGLTKNTKVQTFIFNEQEIEVKQYLPIQDKLSILGNVLAWCQDVDANNFVNVGKMYLFLYLELVFNYSNIKFTEKQKEDPAKLYDLLMGSGFMHEFISNMDNSEYNQMIDWCIDTANHFYQYRNSVYGILDSLNTDYKNLELDANSLREKMADPESVGFLKEVLTKLG